MEFQLSDLNAIILLRSLDGEIIKVSKNIPNSFFNMLLLVDGTYYDSNDNTYWHKNIKKIFTPEGEFYQEEYFEITKYLTKNKKLEQDLRKDPLTNISNVKAVGEMQVEIELAKKSCVIVMCDINDFKSINDIYGHIMGDKALIEISNLFKNDIRGKQDLVARVGGDEFLFLFITNNIMSIMDKMNKLQEKVRNLGEKLGLPLSISIGISSFEYGDEWENKKKEADYALYYAKNSANKDNIAYYNSDTKECELFVPSSNQLTKNMSKKRI